MPIELDEIHEGGTGPCVRVTTYEGTPDVIERAVALTTEYVVPALRSMPGWMGAIGLVSFDGKRALTLTFWDSQETMTESSRAVGDMRKRAAAAGLAVTDTERLRVAFEEK